MYCKNCGNEINQNAVVCIHCGCAVEQQKPATEAQKTNVLGIIGFVLAFIVPLAGLICSIIGYKRADRDYNGNCKGLALAGTIISAISLAISVAVAIWGIASWIVLWTTITAPLY
ncbi:MAG: hypothetical protein K2J16_04395 [Clostridia bacterium]|nr:hypothetical protein [Clostridia bacterium]